MSETEVVFYKMMIFGVPILLTVLAFIGSLAVNALITMGKDVNQIKITIRETSIRHDGLEKSHDELKERVLIVEKKLFDC